MDQKQNTNPHTYKYNKYTTNTMTYIIPRRTAFALPVVFLDDELAVYVPQTFRDHFWLVF